MKAKTCFFIGHREAAGDIMPALEKSVEKHISEYGVTAFVVGRYGGFDQLAASAVIKAKRLHPEITLSLLLAYHPAERPVEKPEGFDATYYPPGMESVPRRYAIARANYKSTLITIVSLNSIVFFEQTIWHQSYIRPASGLLPQFCFCGGRIACRHKAACSSPEASVLLKPML